MQQLLSVWTALGVRQRLIVIGATGAMMLAVLGLARFATAPNMALLYAGLENGAAGEVVQALESRGIAYDIRGGSIFVPDTERDALRLTLASEGLPSNSSQGYELLDGLSGFGTTSQMFDAAYWRAKEGELARTIVAQPDIASARVHIANSSANPFQRDVAPSASVSVSTDSGTVTPQQARAFRYLVASAVPGMAPEDVSVIDGRGGLIGTEDGTGAGADDRADTLRDRVQRLVEARVGTGNAVVEVSVDTVTESEMIRERRFDPDGRVAISTDTEERTDSSQDAGSGDVTVASNLPDGEAGEGDGSSSSQASETRERVNYEVSETTREITRAPGAIRRLTVAVLVNGTYTPNANGGQDFQPLPEEELADLRALVESAVGYDAERGDAVTIRSLPFERPDGLGTGPIEPGLFAGPLDMMRLIQAGILAFVALLLGLFVLRPILSQAIAAEAVPDALPAPEGQSGELVQDAEAMGIASDNAMDDLPALAGGGDFGGMGMVDFDAVDGFGGGEGEEDDPVARLRGLIEERKSETVEILRSWLDEKEEAK